MSMDPFSAIAVATSIAKALGIDRTVGQALGGKRGAEIAEKINDTAMILTGGGTVESINKRLQEDLNLNAQLQTRILEIIEAEAQREAEDRANARNMQVAALAQDDLFSKRFVYYFATAWSLFAMSYLAFITFSPIPPENQRFADTILGFLLGTIIATIIVYFYGSSKGSHGKDSTMNSLVEAMRNKK